MFEANGQIDLGHFDLQDTIDAFFLD